MKKIYLRYVGGFTQNWRLILAIIFIFCIWRAGVSCSLVFRTQIRNNSAKKYFQQFMVENHPILRALKSSKKTFLETGRTQKRFEVHFLMHVLKVFDKLLFRALVSRSGRQILNYPWSTIDNVVECSKMMHGKLRLNAQ